MIKLLNPRYIVPIHGEFKMLTALKRNGEDLGMNDNHLLIIVNGQKVRLYNNHKAEVTDEFVDIYDNFVDGDKVISKDIDSLLKYRETLSTDGIISVTIVIDKKAKKLKQLPVFMIRGSFHSMNSNELINKISFSIKNGLEGAMNKATADISNDEINTIVKSAVDYYI
jgi:ribonuclease J